MKFRLSLAGVAAVVIASWGLHAQPLEPYQPNTDLLPAPLEPNQPNAVITRLPNGQAVVTPGNVTPQVYVPSNSGPKMVCNRYAKPQPYPDCMK
jgi:hypothetical protein